MVDKVCEWERTNVLYLCSKITQNGWKRTQIFKSFRQKSADWLKSKRHFNLCLSNEFESFKIYQILNNVVCCLKMNFLISYVISDGITSKECI